MRLRLHPANALTLVFGLGFVAAGVYAHRALGEDLARAREATAVVVEVVYETGTMQKGRVHPVVRFTTADGREVVGRSDKHHKSAAGDRVQIVYDPARPEHIDIGTLKQAQRQRWFFSGAAVALGLALAGGALALERRNRSRPGS